jgi:thioredoxin reductase
MVDGRTVPRQVLFVPPSFVPNNHVLADLEVATDAKGWVTVGPHGATSVPGVWVAGNVANPRAQVITAAGEGSAAAIAINGDLVDDDIRTAVNDFNQGFTS